MATIMDDEYYSLQDPETVVFHAFIRSTGEAVLAPARKTLSTVRAVRRFCSSIMQNLQNALITRSIYDLHYQYERSLEISEPVSATSHRQSSPTQI